MSLTFLHRYPLRYLQYPNKLLEYYIVSFWTFDLSLAQPISSLNWRRRGNGFACVHSYAPCPGRVPRTAVAAWGRRRRSHGPSRPWSATKGAAWRLLRRMTCVLVQSHWEQFLRLAAVRHPQSVFLGQTRRGCFAGGRAENCSER